MEELEFRKLEKRILCNYCCQPTGFTQDDFDDNKDLADVYCSDNCRYASETDNLYKE